MGKAAKNERWKLRATFLNNIAVVLVATALAVPAYSLLIKTGEEFTQWIRAITPIEALERGFGVVSVLFLAMLLHLVAAEQLSHLED
jgi:hypothetical protein